MDLQERVKTLENRVNNLLLISPAIGNMVALFEKLAKINGYEVVKTADGLDLVKIPKPLKPAKRKK